MKGLITFLLLCVSTGLAYSEDQDISKPPYFYLQGSVGNNAGLAMRCYGETPYEEIDCSFMQIQVSASTPEQTTKTKKETLKEIENIKKNDIEQFKKSFTGQDMSKLKENIKKSTIEQKAYYTDFLQLYKKLEKVNDKASLKKAISEFDDFQGATCKISQHTYDFHFVRVSRNKWLYNPGPEGLCNVVRIATLENTTEYPELWVYTETVASADQDDECKKWVDVGKAYISRWDAPKSLKFERCKYIEYVF